MGYLLKEALKTLCGVNQWSYAVFWKIALQNPELLVWEECYHAPVSSSSLVGISERSRLAFGEWDQCFFSGAPQNPRAGDVAEDMVPSLMNKMILANRVKIVGEGLVGRAAFSGNHLWILSDDYTKETHPSEVENEVFEQFSASIKTLAVIPIYTHGVVQFGSFSAIIENMTFVNDVKNLLLQVGCVPGALLSDNYMPRELSNFGIPLSHNESNFSSGICKLEESLHQQQSVSSQTSEFNGLPPSTMTQLQANPYVSFSNLQASKMASNIVKSQDDVSLIHTFPTSLPVSSQFSNNEGRGVEVIPSNPELWLNNRPSFNILRSGFDEKQPFVGEVISSDSILKEYGTNGMSFSECLISQGDAILRLLLDPNADMRSLTPVVNRPNDISSSSMVSKSSMSHHMASSDSIMQTSYHDDKSSQVKDVRMKGKIEDDLTESVCGFDHLIQNNMFTNQSSLPGSSGDDLFDILGSDFKSKLFGDSWNDIVNCGSDSSSEKVQKIFTPEYHQDADLNIYSAKGGTDHLLDAVVSKLNSGSVQKFDNDVSSGTTLTNVSSSSVANVSPSCSQLKGLDKTQGKLSGLPMSLAKLAGLGSVSLKPDKEDTGNYSQTSSLYGSQVSSWVEQGLPSGKQYSSGSKSADEVGKSNRKRSKPGESTRPRPKDRQMIQDRMKELREIVPNGSKLSIDALLERTIKHMLFLQSVTTHADKLKQSGESKIINKDGGLVLRDGFEGGRTWACEVGSQNLLCPIIVEDLNPPRQMLIEMLCEDRGLFLEIADIIRGMGLTILKGVMETQNNKIWAQFVVEADRDVTRMEIFLSLVHLLEQTIKSIPSPCTGIDSSVIPLNHVASIPATGRPTNLQ